MIKLWHPYRKIMLYATTKFLSRWLRLGFICMDSNWVLTAYGGVKH